MQDLLLTVAFRTNFHVVIIKYANTNLQMQSETKVLEILTSILTIYKLCD